MEFAIVDIETTGGNPQDGGITEIAVLIHDGTQVVDSFHSLINPERHIPGFITGLTGIDQDMVAGSPVFAEIAQELYGYLEDRIFVAHNVNFDYTFIREAFRKENYPFDAPKLCTVRLSRKAFPGHRTYSLGRICEQLGIRIRDRHRAFGDAEATAVLFGKIYAEQPDIITQSLKKNNGESFLPPNISKASYNALPNETGVYYFHDAQGKVIYVGKALDIRNRFKGHFSGNSREKSKMELKTEIHDVTWELTGSEFLAYLIEMLEIKRLWPKYNKAQKFKTSNWALLSYEDSQGFIRFHVSKLSGNVPAVMRFDSHAEAWKFLQDKVAEYELCPKLSGIQKVPGACYDFGTGKCLGACCGAEEVMRYNSRATAFLETCKVNEGNILIREKGRSYSEQTALLFENGVFAGYSFISKDEAYSNETEILESLRMVKRYPETKYILKSFITKISLNNIQIIKANS